MDDLAGLAENATNKGEQGSVQDQQDSLWQVSWTTDEPVKDKQRQLLTPKAKIDARWGEHFSEVLNR